MNPMLPPVLILFALTRPQVGRPAGCCLGARGGGATLASCGPRLVQEKGQIGLIASHGLRVRLPGWSMNAK